MRHDLTMAKPKALCASSRTRSSRTGVRDVGSVTIVTLLHAFGQALLEYIAKRPGPNLTEPNFVSMNRRHVSANGSTPYGQTHTQPVEHTLFGGREVTNLM